jgi:hypothetical protein
LSPITRALCPGGISTSPARRIRRAPASVSLYFAFEDNALVMVLAAGRPGHRFHMLSPAPPRLVDEAGDVRLAEKYDLNGYER